MSGKSADKEDVPRYLQVLATIRERIRDGTYQDQIPAQKALADELGVAPGTVAHALQILAEDGTLNSATGHGTHINRTPPDSGQRMST
jgi:DNA-binding GntR family transcriptional regulator